MMSSQGPWPQEDLSLFPHLDLQLIKGRLCFLETVHLLFCLLRDPEL